MADTQQDGLSISPDILERAYAYCDALTAAHSRSFHMASSLLPDEKKRAVRALYAFCRVTDDVVDRPTGDPATGLEQWREKALSAAPPSDDLVAIAWADARLRFRIPPHYAEQLMSGVARDLHQNRYETFEDLAGYSYGVASTVGLMSMHITGFSHKQAIPYAVKLGVALQVTNILRDVAEDWRNGRVYLPQQEMWAFGLSDKDLAAGVVTDRWREFMRFQVARNRQLYQEAWPGIGLLHSDGRFAIGAAAGLYGGILDDIESNGYDVFSRRAYISTSNKLVRLPAIWWRSQRAKPNLTDLPHFH
jgi:phytoene synthase